MVFLLDDKNIFSYLTDQNFCLPTEQNLIRVETKSCKNFNLLIHLSDHQHLLVKQEPHDCYGETKGDLWHEWRVHQLLQTHSDLQPLLKLVSEILHFDSQHAILIAHYQQNYYDLDHFYTDHRVFPPAIATALGYTLARLHRATFDRLDYQHFLEQDDPTAEFVPDIVALEQLTPEVFGRVSQEGLKFYALYQRYESLRRAIEQLQRSHQPCCLTHQDLKFDNILLHQDWEGMLCRGDFAPGLEESAISTALDGSNSQSPAIIRLIDWEKWAWADPASDLGMLIAGYLKIWLKSLGLRSGMEINLALQVAGIPLEQLQPSIVALTQAYLSTFPAIVSRFPNFLSRVIQFTGLALIESIQAKLYYREPFGNTEIGLLQVAKTLLCAPEQSVATVFGISATELLQCLQQPWPKPQQVSQSVPLKRKSAQHHPPQSSLSGRSEIGCPPLSCTPDQMLQDLVNHVQLRSDGVHHPHYPLPAVEMLQTDRLQRLPVDLQRHDLRTQLRNFLYDLYFSGELRVCSLKEEADAVPLKNNAVAGLNVPFFDQIQRHNHGTGYWDAGWQVVRKVGGRYAVQKAELTIYIDPQQHLRPEQQRPQVGNVVEIRLPNHCMAGDSYVAVSNVGWVPVDCPALELCFHVTPSGALALMHHLTLHLNAMQIPFSFKMLANPEDYGRYDAAALHLECRYYSELRQMLRTVYIQNRTEFYPAVPLFMKVIAPGVGLAEQPQEDEFGMHRFQRVADALLEVWQQQKNVGNAPENTSENTSEIRLTAIQQQFLQHKINWHSPYLNATEDRDQKDCYEPLEV